MNRPSPVRPPLPGTQPPLRGLFVDRWGTLLEPPARGFCSRFEEARFTPRAVESLFRAQQGGWRIYLVGNEDAVARGRQSEASWRRFEADLLAHLASQGVPVARSYACLDHPQGTGPHRKSSVFLLPDTGAFYHAAQTDGIALRESWVVGDGTLELAAGQRASLRTVAVRTGLALSDAALHVEPDLCAADLAEVVALLLKSEGCLRR